MGYIIHLAVPTQVCKLLTPHSKRFFRPSPEIIADELFQRKLDQCMEEWKEVRQQGLKILLWWELLVKPGVLKIGLSRSKELNKQKRGELNLLLIRQAYLGREIFRGNLSKLSELRFVQEEVNAWYQRESEKIVLQSRTKEVNVNEKVRIYHHELHRKKIKQSTILRLETDVGVVEGHEQCAKYLEQQVEDLLLNQHVIDSMSMSD